MFKIRKSFAVVFSFLLCTLSFGPEVCAETPLDSFVQLVYSRKDNFVFDLKNRDRLTAELDSKLPKGISKAKNMEFYHKAVQNILDANGEVRYNCRVLFSWVHCELCKRHVACEDCMLFFYNDDRCSGVVHTASLIPDNVDGKKIWYVCDLSLVSELKRPDLILMELKDYLGMFGEKFIGVRITSDTLDATTLTESYKGRDIVAWLATEGRDREYAVELLKTRVTPEIRVVSSPDTLECDADIIEELILSMAPELASKGIDYVRFLL